MNPQNAYFGGPIFDKLRWQWRNAFYARGNGDVLGALENAVPLPQNMSSVVRSTGAMSGSYASAKRQSCIWVGPRLLISTLHFHPWVGEYPTVSECEIFKNAGTLFHVENEISMMLLGPYSVTVRLVSFSVDNDIGIFKLHDTFPDRPDYINYNCLIERDEVHQQGIRPGTKAACVGFSAAIPEKEASMIIQGATYELFRQVPHAPFPVSFYRSGSGTEWTLMTL